MSQVAGRHENPGATVLSSGLGSTEAPRLTAEENTVSVTMVAPEGAYSVLAHIIDLKQGLRDAVTATDAGSLDHLATNVTEPFLGGDMRADAVIGPALDAVFTARGTVVLDMLNRVQEVVDGVVQIVQAYQKYDEAAASRIASIETRVDQSSQAGWPAPMTTPYR